MSSTSFSIQQCFENCLTLTLLHKTPCISATFGRKIHTRMLLFLSAHAMLLSTRGKRCWQNPPCMVRAHQSSTTHRYQTSACMPAGTSPSRRNTIILADAHASCASSITHNQRPHHNNLQSSTKRYRYTSFDVVSACSSTSPDPACDTGMSARNHFSSFFT